MLGERLALLRESKKLTKKRAAEELQIPYTTYLHYENNENEPNNEVLVKLAVYYGVSVDYLLGRKAEEKEKSPPRTKREELREALSPLVDKLEVSQLKELIKYCLYLVWLKENHKEQD